MNGVRYYNDAGVQLLNIWRDSNWDEKKVACLRDWSIRQAAKERRVTGGANGCMRERMIRINNEG